MGAVAPGDVIGGVRAGNGFTLIEIIAVVTIIAVLLAMGLPLFGHVIDEHRTASAAHYLASQCALARMEAVKRSTRVGLRFEGDGTDTRWATHVDGNANGIRTRDIASGIDWQLTPAVRLVDLFPGVTFGLHPSIPEIGTSVLSPDVRDPLRIGSSDIVTFTPIGTSTSGTLYLRGRGQVQFAVRLFGVTGRSRVLRFDTGAREWVTR
jgi:prepilin-type N-terminal cleavage/methylation domain-containing protein